MHSFFHLSSTDSTNIDVDFGNYRVNIEHLEKLSVCHIVSVMQTLAIHIFTRIVSLAASWRHNSHSRKHDLFVLKYIA